MSARGRVGTTLILMAAALTMAAAGPCAGAANAAPAVVPAPPTGGASSTVDLGTSNWPADLRWAVPGTTEFNSKYPGTSADTGCGAGTDIYGYAHDFVLNTGTILGALSTATGRGAMAGFLGGSDSQEQGIPTSPFQTVDPDVTVSRGADSWDIGRLRDFRDKTNPDVKASGPGTVPCAKDFAAFGKPSTDSPFGFTFYDAPDQGSVDSMILNVGSDQRGGATKSAKDFWTTGAWETGDDFKVTDTQHYCSDEINPLCLTAMFLHCPDPTTTRDATALAAISNCRIFNSNMLILNAHLKAAVFAQGAADGSALHPWALMLSAGRQLADAAHKGIVIGLVVLGVAIVAGALVTGGILAALIAAGVYTVLATGGWDAVWGTVTCSASFDKCLAEGGAKAMASATNMIGTAASNAPLPSLTGSDTLFNTLAGVSGWIMLILLLLSLIGAVFTGRMGQIIPASVGVLRWGIAMGIGATVLSLAFAASNAASDAIARTGTSGKSIQAFARSITTLVMKIGGADILGWLLVAVLCLVGAVAAVVVWVILTMSYQFIPLAIALMIVQMAGSTGNETLRKWINRGWGLLWTILLLRPVITLVAELADVQAMTGTIEGLVGAVTLVLLCAVAPWLIVAMFPLAASGGLGVMRAMATAAQGIDSAARLGQRAGAAAIAGASRAQMLAHTLTGAGRTPALAGATAGGGSGGGSSAGPGSPGGSRGNNRAVTGAGQQPPPHGGVGGGGAFDPFAPPSTGPRHRAPGRGAPTPAGEVADTAAADTSSDDTAGSGSTGEPADGSGSTGTASHPDPATGTSRPGAGGRGTSAPGAGRAGAATAAAATAGTAANALRAKGFGANLPPRVTRPAPVPATGEPGGGPATGPVTGLVHGPSDGSGDAGAGTRGAAGAGGGTDAGRVVGGGAGRSGAAPPPASSSGPAASIPSTQPRPAGPARQGSRPPTSPARPDAPTRADNSDTDTGTGTGDHEGRTQ